MKVIGFGSRRYLDARLVRSVLLGLHATRHGTESFVVVVGVDPERPKGADGLIWAVRNEIPWAQFRPYPAEWKVHHPDWCPGDACRKRAPKNQTWDYCMVAGPRRNQQMLDAEHTETEPIDFGIGFVDKTLRSSRGSYDMTKRLGTAEIPFSVLWTPRSPSGAQLGEPRTSAGLPTTVTNRG